jgi:heme-degrading monooxygenase HmoA
MMMTAIVEYTLPPSIGRQECLEHFTKIAPGFREVPGFLRKHFLYSEAGVGGGVYLWESREDAERFYTGPWLEGIRRRDGVDPTSTYFETLVICDVAEPAIRVTASPAQPVEMGRLHDAV